MREQLIRCKITTLFSLIAALVLASVANAQQNEADLVEKFDDIPPAIEDNLPPDAAAEDILTLTQTEPDNIDENIFTPSISSNMMPFNSKRIDLVEALQQPINQVNIAGISYPLVSPDLVNTFYQVEQFPTIWTHENTFSPQVNVLKQAIAESNLDGLNPQHYHYSLIANLNTEQTYPDITAYEILFTDAYLSLANHLANGLADPTHTHREWNADTVDALALSENLAQAFIHQDYLERLASFNANNIRYQALKSQLNALSNSSVAIDDEPLPAVNLKFGITHPAVGILRQKLGLADGSNYFDEEVLQAVKNYQTNIGISADGVVGPGTRALLNTSRQDVINKLLINMERQRWLPQELGNPYILVNIPSYKVEVLRDNQVVYQSKTIVGRKDRPTPAFTNRMQHIVMSPTWTVPPTILRKDKLPKLRNNPGAFDGSYEVVTPSGKVVRPSAINWNAVNASSYSLRQKPGRHNALGRIKFLFPNKHAIYLHDTPNKSLFSRANRAYSSGCVRIEDPLDFANILLENTEWTPEKIKSATTRSSERWIDLSNETPIYLVYWTVWADNFGHIKFAQDIYNLDAKLLKQYQQAVQ